MRRMTWWGVHAWCACTLGGGAHAAVDEADRTSDQVLTYDLHEPGDLFGWAVAASGDLAVVSAHHQGGNNRGGAVVFRRDHSRWSQEAFLQPTLSRNYGSSVACDGDRVVVSTSQYGQPVWIYHDDGVAWVVDEIVPPPAGASEFGYDVAIDGTWLAVADRNGDHVFMYEEVGSTWVLRQQITGYGSSFAQNIALCGTHLLVGGGHSWAFSFDGASWAFERQLASPSASQLACVALEGDLAAVATDLSVHVYRRSGGGWQEDAELLVRPKAVGVSDGTLSITEEALCVSLHRPIGGVWTEVVSWEPTSTQQHFGLSVAYEHPWNLAGSPFSDVGGDFEAGAAFSFEATDLFLHPTDLVYGVGDVIDLETTSGEPGTPMMYAVVSVNGLSTFYRLALRAFDGSGEAHWNATVPPSAIGLDVEVAAFGDRAGRSFTLSNLARLSIQ